MRRSEGYNYFRDYNPETGRYIESDPIGLQGGLNTYGYVDSSPAVYVDPFGLLAGSGADLYMQLKGMAGGLGAAAKCYDYFCARVKRGGRGPGVFDVLTWCTENAGGDAVECNYYCQKITVQNNDFEKECSPQISMFCGQ